MERDGARVMMTDPFSGYRLLCMKVKYSKLLHKAPFATATLSIDMGKILSKNCSSVVYSMALREKHCFVKNREGVREYMTAE